MSYAPHSSPTCLSLNPPEHYPTTPLRHIFSTSKDENYNMWQGRGYLVEVIADESRATKLLKVIESKVTYQIQKPNKLE